MGELVALAMEGGSAFVDMLQRVWDDGDAVLPVDPHAPKAHLDRVLAAMRPGAIVESDGERRALPDGVATEDGDAVVIVTSGTTGAAKGAVHTHAGVAAAARITADACGASAGSEARWLACLPLAHVGGFSVITRALIAGAELQVSNGADAERIDAAARAGATHVSLVPTLLGRIDPSLWQLILLGGSAIPPERPANTVATYGMTETFGGVVYDGRALDGIEMRIDADGAISLRSPTLLRSYRGGPLDRTTPVDAEGWYATGDIGAIDDDGTLSVSGRSDDLIISGGTNVWPQPVEDVLRSDPGIDDVAVAGRPDAEWGERVVAFVVAADPSSPPTLDQLRDRVKAQLPAAAAPKEIVLLDVLPRTALGKIARHMLPDGGTTDDHTEQDGPTDAHR